MDQASHNKIVSFIWGIADDVLRGEHWTPRDAVRLMTTLMFRPIADKVKAGSYLLYDVREAAARLPEEESNSEPEAASEELASEAEQEEDSEPEEFSE